MRYRTLCIALILLFATVSFADELIVDFSEDSVTILNEELRKIHQDIKTTTDGTYSTSATTNITATGGITVTKKIMRIQGSGGAVDITASPQIADSVDGRTVILQGDSDTNTVQLDDGTGLQLAGAASFTMGQGDIIQLTYDSGSDVWIEISRSNN